MENAEGYNIIANIPYRGEPSRQRLLFLMQTAYFNIISCDGYNDAYLSAKNENPYSDFLK